MNFIMIGFDGVGKTTMLNKLTNNNYSVLPMIGLDIETRYQFKIVGYRRSRKK